LTRGLFVGRFQPFHKGHLATVKYALQSVDQLIIAVGSAQKSHEAENPFTAGERIEMIKSALDNDGQVDLRKIFIIPVPDVEVHSLWTRQVDMLVPAYDVVFANDPFTLLLFRERNVKTVEAPLYNREEMSATEVRRRMIMGNDWKELVPGPVADFIGRIGGQARLKAIAAKDSRHVHH
jgi:nicotinamide-nucleotide adenylyltransferase